MKKYIKIDTTSINGYDSPAWKKEFEDFCDLRYVDRLSDEEIIDLARKIFFKKFNSKKDIKFLEVDKEAWWGFDSVTIDKEDKDLSVIIYSLQLRRDEEPDEDDEFWQYYDSYNQKPPEVVIKYKTTRVDEYFDWNYNSVKCDIRLREMDSERESFYFSDFTLQRLDRSKGLFSFPEWTINPDYLVFMVRKFGIDYYNQFITTRKAYREYYIAKEMALRDECMRLMNEHKHPIMGVKGILPKTTEKFIDCTPEEVLKAFHFWYGWEPNVIDVTNFQTLRNEDIKPENKDMFGRTILRRVRYGRNDKGPFTIEERQERAEHSRINENGERVYYYTKKQQPVHQVKRQFSDFGFDDSDWNIDPLIHSSIERLKYGEWTGIMYSAFGEPYATALKQTFDAKLSKWVCEFDGTTYIISQFVNGIGNNFKKIEGEIWQ